MNEKDKKYVIKTICDRLKNEQYTVSCKPKLHVYAENSSKTDITFTKNNITKTYSILDSFFDNIGKECATLVVEDNKDLESLTSIANSEIDIHRNSNVKEFISNIKDLKNTYSKRDIYFDFCFMGDGIDMYTYNDNLIKGLKTASRLKTTIMYLIILEPINDLIELSNSIIPQIERCIAEGRF